MYAYFRPDERVRILFGIGMGISMLVVDWWLYISEEICVETAMR